MASIIVDQGLQNSLDNTFGVVTQDAVDAMGVSDFGTLSAGTTDIAAATNSDVSAFDSTPTRTDQTVSCVTTWGTSEANFTITTITLHFDGAAATTGVYGGVDGQSITKTSDFSLKITLKVTYTSA